MHGVTFARMPAGARSVARACVKNGACGCHFVRLNLILDTARQEIAVSMNGTGDDHVIEGLTLDHYSTFPHSLLDVPSHQLWRHLKGPSLFRIEGRNDQPLFVSVLLHGNEDTGWQAVQSVLRDALKLGMPRTLLLFVGNIEAAKANVRTLPLQTDYNRTWPGTAQTHTPEAALMRQVTGIVRKASPFASIDIHNNTGHNPHYACVNELAEPFLHLARLFSRTVVYFKAPLGVQSAAMADICPAVTVECGRVGGTAGVAHAAEFVRAALSLSHFPDHAVPDHDLDLLQTRAIVKVPNTASFSFDGSPADFEFRADLDHLNFAELEPGTVLGRLGRERSARLDVSPGGDFKLQAAYFDYDDGNIRLNKTAVPAMLTLDPNAVRLDCLGYLMHRIGRDGVVL